MAENKALASALEWIVDINPREVLLTAAEFQYEGLDMTERELVEKLFNKARWKVAASGVAAGLPSNPWAAVPAATADVAVTLKTEVLAVAQAAAIYDSHFFDREEARWELLIPTLGLSQDGQFLKEMGVNAQNEVSHYVFRKTLTRESLKTFKQLVLKHFVRKVTKNGIFSKSIPLVGSIISGSWNYMEINQVRDRTIAYFQDRQIQMLREAAAKSAETAITPTDIEPQS